jgi:hypothetical protein
MTTETTTPVAREVPLAPGGYVEILLTSANVSVRGVDGDRVSVRTRGGEDIDEEVVVEATPQKVRISDNQAGSRAGGLGRHGRRPADLDIDLPRTARVSLRSLSGDVEAFDIGGESHWASASGDLRVELDAGSVGLESMSGDIKVEASAAVEVRARSVSGDLTLRAPRFERLSASSTSGDVRIAGALGDRGEHVVSSVSGDVDLTTASEVRVETKSITGDVRAIGTWVTEGGRGRRTLVVGAGSIGVSIRTTSGDIRLRGEVPTPAVPPVPEIPRLPVAPVPPEAPEPQAAPPPVVIAEAEAAPNLVRPTTPHPDDPADTALGAAGPTDRREEARLEILRALERGDLDIESASHRLEILEDAGPRYFRGWC